MLSAHPVIFKGGKVIWLIDSPDITDIRFGKTLTRNWYSGIQIFNHKYDEQSFIASNNNLLIKRNPFYAKANLTIASSNISKNGMKNKILLAIKKYLMEHKDASNS